MKYVIGLTGGFGSGKTTIAQFFKKMGASVVDADRLVHEIYNEDKNIQKKVVALFGRDVKGGKELIDRKKLGMAAFRSKASLRKLCKVIHPAVIRRIRKEVKNSERKIVVIDAPLFFEAGLLGMANSVVVVTASRTKRAGRCYKKGFKRSDIKKRFASQMPLIRKAKLADFVVDNNFSKEKSKKQVAGIWHKLFKEEKNGKSRS